MVLWCFNVTVPDPVLLRCYQCSETTTNQKQDGLSLSRLPTPPLHPFWCCLSPWTSADHTVTAPTVCFIVHPSEATPRKAQSSLPVGGERPAYGAWQQLGPKGRKGSGGPLTPLVLAGSSERRTHLFLLQSRVQVGV